MEGMGEQGRLMGREAVAALAASGQSIKAYCESSGQSEWSMRRWRVEFGEALGVPMRRRPGFSKAQARAKPMARAQRLIPIVIGEAKPTPSDLRVEIRLRDARSIIVSPSIDSATLSRLIGAVERVT